MTSIPQPNSHDNDTLHGQRKPVAALSPSAFAASVRFAASMETSLGRRKFNRLVRSRPFSLPLAGVIRWHESLPPADRLRVTSIPAFLQWLRDGEALLPLEAPDWLKIDTLGGYCPVQGEGTVDGYPWYFRSRHEDMGIAVGVPGSEPLDEWDECTIFSLALPYPNEGSEMAGYLEPPQALGFIVRSLEAFRDEHRAAEP